MVTVMSLTCYCFFILQISNFIKDQEKHTDTKTDDDAHNKMVADIFKQEDADKDGYISFDEFSGPKHEEL